MINNTPRIGNFTSSEIAALLSMGTRTMTEEELKKYKAENPKGRKTTIESWPGTTALTYIEEKNFERKLGRSLSDEINSKATTWGSLLESRVFDLLGLEYTLTSKETVVHPELSCWAGSKDGMKYDEGKTVIDIKAPLTLKSFCQLVKPLYMGINGMDAMNMIRNEHQKGEQYYWQLVSNSILDDTQYAELIVYMPYESELEEIKEMARNVPTDQLSKHYWIAMANDGDLPFLPDGGYYKNLNVIRFEVPQEHKDLLTRTVKMASSFLISFHETVVEEIVIEEA